MAIAEGRDEVRSLGTIDRSERLIMRSTSAAGVWRVATGHRRNAARLQVRSAGMSLSSRRSCPPALRARAHPRPTSRATPRTALHAPVREQRATFARVACGEAGRPACSPEAGEPANASSGPSGGPVEASSTPGDTCNPSPESRPRRLSRLSAKKELHAVHTM